MRRIYFLMPTFAIRGICQQTLKFLTTVQGNQVDSYRFYQISSVFTVDRYYIFRISFHFTVILLIGLIMCCVSLKLLLQSKYVYKPIIICKVQGHCYNISELL